MLSFRILVLESLYIVLFLQTNATFDCFFLQRDVICCSKESQASVDIPSSFFYCFQFQISLILADFVVTSNRKMAYAGISFHVIFSKPIETGQVVSAFL